MDYVWMTSGGPRRRLGSARRHDERRKKLRALGVEALAGNALRRFYGQNEVILIGEHKSQEATDRSAARLDVDDGHALIG